MLGYYIATRDHIFHIKRCILLLYIKTAHVLAKLCIGLLYACN